jgi:nicotinamidase-related amidase
MAQSFRATIGLGPSTASLNDSVLLLVDVQNEYHHGKLAVKNFNASASAISQLLNRYRAAGGDVIHVFHETSAEAPIFTTGTELAEPWDGVKPRDGESVVKKPAPISFTGTLFFFFFLLLLRG